MPVTESSALEYLETHPDEGSMLAYSDALNYYKIENAAVRITQEDLTSLPTPFVAFSQIHGGTFSVVKNLTENTIEWFDTQKGWVKDKLEDFTKTWSGVVLLAETDEKSGEKNYTTKRRDEILRNIRIPVAVALTAFIFLYFIINAPLVSTPSHILLGLKAIGMVISTLLFVKSIDNANSLVNKLCNAGSKISCQSILDSPAAKITPWLSLSDIGFVYFVSSFISILLLGSDLTAFLAYHTLVSILALLFGAYSIYYQGKIARMWCPLCLGVVGVLAMEALIVFLNYEPFFTISATFVISLLISLALPIAFLLFYKNELVKAIERDALKNELSRLKSNPQIIDSLMASQKPMPFLPNGMGILSIGNKHADHVLTIISNPLCNPCAKMHERIEKVLDKSDNLRCDIVFVTNHNDLDIGGKVVRKILSLPANLQEEATSLWYRNNNRNFDNWNKRYHDFEEKEVAELFRKEQKQWSDDAEIKSTPTLFYNGKKLPNIIKVEDLEFATLTKTRETTTKS